MFDPIFDRPLIKKAIANGERFWAHAFEYTGATSDIEHRTTKAKHPSQPERFTLDPLQQMPGLS